MPLADEADVKRILGDANAEVTWALEAADEWVSRWLRHSFSTIGAQITTYLNTRGDALLPRPPGVVDTITGDGTLLTYTLDDRRIRLTATKWVYKRVDISWTNPAPAAIPAPVREGTALLAATIYGSKPQGNMQSETIGEYQYTVMPAKDEDVPNMVKLMLRPYRRGGGVTVI